MLVDSHKEKYDGFKCEAVFYAEINLPSIQIMHSK